MRSGEHRSDFLRRAPRRPVWRVARVVGDTQRRPGGREKRGRWASAVRDASQLLHIQTQFRPTSRQ